MNYAFCRWSYSIPPTLLNPLDLNNDSFQVEDEDKWEKIVKEMEKFYAKEGKPELDRSVAGWDIGSYQCLMLMHKNFTYFTSFCHKSSRIYIYDYQTRKRGVTDPSFWKRGGVKVSYDPPPFLETNLKVYCNFFPADT